MTSSTICRMAPMSVAGSRPRRRTSSRTSRSMTPVASMWREGNSRLTSCMPPFGLCGHRGGSPNGPQATPADTPDAEVGDAGAASGGRREGGFDLAQHDVRDLLVQVVPAVDLDLHSGGAELQ